MFARMWKKENPYTLLMEKLVQRLWKTVWIFLKKLAVELLYDLAIPLQSIYLKFKKKRKCQFNKNTFSPMFRAVLFTSCKNIEVT